MHPGENVLNELVEGTLGGAERQEAVRHLTDCAECRSIVDELRELRRAASSLEQREPPSRVWPRLERAIRLEQDGTGVQRLDRNGRRGLFGLSGWRLAGTGVAAAAIVVLATVVTLRVAAPRSQQPASNASTQTASGGADTAQAVEAELRQASEHYERAIRGLEQIANAEQSSLDPQTAATLRKNLAVIDQAISDSRTALRTQPNSEPAQQSLIDSFKSKIALLQDTVALINEMRKGNEAGAARIVSGLKQKG